MRWSFIHPKSKRLLDPESRLLAIFLAVTMLLIIGFVAFLFFRNGTMKEEVASMNMEMSRIERQNAKYRAQIARIERLAAKHETIRTNNTLLKESIQNLFDLIPDQITLTKAVLDEHGLVLYGVTPSKDIYNYLLLAPLKSVFQRNSTSFYPLKNGWWRFVSVNEGSIELGGEVSE